jgi:hypothetical protein
LVVGFEVQVDEKAKIDDNKSATEHSGPEVPCAVSNVRKKFEIIMSKTLVNLRTQVSG